MARFYWVFDGFVLEPERVQDYQGPQNGLRELQLRQELHERFGSRYSAPPIPKASGLAGEIPGHPRKAGTRSR